MSEPEPLRLDEGLIVPKLIVEDKQQRRRIELCTDHNGDPQMLFYDRSGELRFGAYLDPDGCAMMFLSGKDTTNGARFSISEGASGSDGETMIVVSVHNTAGETLFAFGTYKDGTPMFSFSPEAAVELQQQVTKHLPPPEPPLPSLN